MVVLMDLVQKRNRTSRCLKLHVPVSQIFGTKRTHSRVPGLKEEALFQTAKFFSYHTYINLYNYCELPDFLFPVILECRVCVNGTQ
jgi:hypothetical protein